MSSKKSKSKSDSEFKNSDSNSQHETESDSSSSSDTSSDFLINIISKSTPKQTKKLDQDSPINSESEPESESASSTELNLGTDSPDSISDTPIQSDNEQETDSESNIDTDLGTSSFDIEPSDQIEKIIGINHPTFSEENDQIMYFVKFKNQSYRTCRWVQEEELMKTSHGKLIHTTFIKNPTPFKKVHFFRETVEDLYKPAKVKFDEGFIVPEQVISIQTKNGQKKFLVKWVSLDVKKSTWETDVPDNLVEEYERRNGIFHRSNYDHSDNAADQEFRPLIESPTYSNSNELFEYQLEAHNFAMKNWFENRDMILCDSEKIDKTIECISILDRLSKMYDSWSPFIVVCPSSSVNFWMNEFDGWTDFRVVCLTGNKNSMNIVKKYMMFHHIDDENKIDLDKIIFDVLIVSYESLSREISFLKKFNFMFAIFDEAQKIKNIEAYIYQECLSIKAHRKLLLSGDLNQYDLFEIWSLFHFISPSKFAKFEKFERKCKNENYKDVIKQYILLRDKNDMNEIKNKEAVVESEMTRLQRGFAQTAVKNHMNSLSDEPLKKGKINNFLTSLQKILCHPFLVPELESVCLSQYKKLNGISKSSKLNSEQEMDSIISSSGKMILLDKLLSKLKEENHKVLVFSSMQKMIDIIENYLILKEYLYERLDGSFSINERTFSIDRFRNIDDVFVFLLSSESDGIGVDLTGADTVIIYDGEYDPRNDILSQSKIHKNSDTKNINIIRLTTNGCYESDILLNDFSNLNFELSDNQEFMSLFNKNLENEESILKSQNKIQMILRKSCYHIFNDDPNKIDDFSLQDIEQILENSTEENQSKIHENKFLNNENFWEDFIHSDSSSSDFDDFDFNTGIRPRTKRKIEKKDEEEYDYNSKDPTTNNNNKSSSNSSSSSSSDYEFSLSSSDYDYDEYDESSHLFDLSDSEEDKENENSRFSSNLYTISLLNQDLSSQIERQNQPFVLPKLKPDSSSDLEVDEESSDEIGDLNSTTSELNESIVMKIFTESLNAVRKHGISGARLFASELLVELGKSLIVLAYSRLSKKEMKKFKNYLHQHIPKMRKQILKTPYKELRDKDFISALFNGEEAKIINDCFNFDRIYRVALFVSTEKLPENFTFAPEMPMPLGWSAIDDFIALTASPLFDDISQIADDEKLPFKTVFNSYRPFKKWIKKRIELIVNELDVVVPNEFSVYENFKGKLKPKKFCDVKIFRNLNYHVLNPKRLTINFQKKLLKILYLYGIPKNNAISKIKKLLKCSQMNIDDLIYIFIEKVLIESIKIKPNLIVLLKSFSKSGSLSFYNNSIVDIRWINRTVIDEIASKLNLFFNVREKFDEKVKLNGLGNWKEIENCCNWWNPKCDKKLFRATAYYGFLFNSMMCSMIPKIGVNDVYSISKWRENEHEALEPLLIPEIEDLKDIFSIEKRENRIIQILDFLES